jgi:hypothetical protein
VTQKDEVSRMNDEVIRTMMLKPLDESMEKKKYLIRGRGAIAQAKISRYLRFSCLIHD